MKIYIAASSQPDERVRVDAAFAGARSAGLEIVGDWRAEVDQHGRNPADQLVAQRAAMADFQAVRRADVVWLLVPRTVTRGAWVELGLALAFQNERGFPVAICSGTFAESIFTSLCHKCYESDLEALRYLCGAL